MALHPLKDLSEAEFKLAGDVVKKLYTSEVTLFFRAIYLQEPKKAELIPFLQAEHEGTLDDSTPRPPRRARLQYDVIKNGKLPEYTTSIVDLETKTEAERIVAKPESQTGYTP